MKFNKNRILSWLLTLALLLSLMPAGIVPASAAEGDVGNKSVIIYELYGGGGNSGATYNQKYVVLKNISKHAVDVNGWSLHYGSATGVTATSRGVISDTTLNIEPGRYLFVSMSSASTTNGVALPVTPDKNVKLSPGGAAGQIFLFDSTYTTTYTRTDWSTKTDSPTDVQGKSIPGLVDFVGYGAASACLGSAAAPAPSITKSIKRNTNCFDDPAAYTPNNSADYTAQEFDFSYLMPPATAHSAPEFSPAGGATVSNPVLLTSGSAVTLAKAAGADSSAKVYYALDTTTDLTIGGTEYTMPIVINGATVIRAIVRGGTLESSTMVTAYYDVATSNSAPVLSPVGGASASAPALVPSGSVVTLAKAAGADSSAKVYYALDTTTDLTTGGTEYIAPIVINGATVIRAIVRGGSMTPSTVTTAYYNTQQMTIAQAIPFSGFAIYC